MVAVVINRRHAHHRFGAPDRKLLSLRDEIFVAPQGLDFERRAEGALALARGGHEREIQAVTPFAGIDSRTFDVGDPHQERSEEHTSELQTLKRNTSSVSVFKKKK